MFVLIKLRLAGKRYKINTEAAKICALFQQVELLQWELHGISQSELSMTLVKTVNM